MVCLSSEFLLSSHISLYRPQFVVISTIFIFRFIGIFYPFLSPADNNFDGIHDCEITILRCCPSVFINSGLYGIPVNFVIVTDKPFQHDLKPFFHQLTSFNTCNKVALVGQIHLWFRTWFLVNFPVCWVIVTLIPKNQIIWQISESVPYQSWIQACDVFNEVKALFNRKTRCVKVHTTMLINQCYSPQIGNQLIININFRMRKGIFYFLTSLFVNILFYVIFCNYI